MVRDRGTANLRIVTVVTAIVACERGEGVICRSQKNAHDSLFEGNEGGKRFHETNSTCSKRSYGFGIFIIVTISWRF